MSRKLVTIVCPVYQEERAVPLFYERLRGVLDPLADRYDFEILFTNNRSTDRTADVVLQLRAADARVQLLTLSRNFGYQHSVLAGLRQARGDAIIVIDVDCEDPPEMIPRFLQGWEDGYDVVYGERDRRVEPAAVTLARKLFYRVNRFVADSDIVLDMAEFALITADVRDAVVASGSTYPFLRAEIAHFGFARKGLRYDRQSRLVGESHYNLLGMTRFAVAGILSSTTVPLRMALYVLPLLFVADAALLVAEATGAWPLGFELMVALDLLYLATVSAFVSLYLARTYHNVVARPLVVVDWARSAVDLPRDRSPNALPRGGARP